MWRQEKNAHIVHSPQRAETVGSSAEERGRATLPARWPQRRWRTEYGRKKIQHPNAPAADDQRRETRGERTDKRQMDESSHQSATARLWRRFGRKGSMEHTLLGAQRGKHGAENCKAKGKDARKPAASRWSGSLFSLTLFLSHSLFYSCLSSWHKYGCLKNQRILPCARLVLFGISALPFLCRFFLLLL